MMFRFFLLILSCHKQFDPNHQTHQLLQEIKASSKQPIESTPVEYQKGDLSTEKVQFSLHCKVNQAANTQDCRFAVESKFYIDALDAENCRQSAKALGLHWSKKLFVFFCQKSDADLKHLPQKPAVTSPPNARISAAFVVQFSCQEGSSTPIHGAISPPQQIGGYEAFVQGVPFTPPVTNQIAEDGRFMVVLGGHPHPLAEPMIRMFGSRKTRDVWLKTTGQIDCLPRADSEKNTDKPQPHIMLHFESTDFPSQKVWLSKNGKTTFVWYKKQGLFSELWFMPAVPMYK